MISPPFLLALPAPLRRALTIGAALIALAGLLWLLKGCYDDAVEERYEAKVHGQVQKAARAADADAAAAAETSRNQVENTNADARKAAAGSDDPLRAGLDRLRTGTPPDRAPAR